MRSRERTESLSLSASSRSVPTSWCKLEPLQQLQQGPPASPGQPASCALPAPPTSASAPSTLASEPPPAMAADEPDQPLSTSFTYTHAFLAGAQELTAVDFDLDPPADLDHDEAKTLASLCNMVRPSSLPAFHDRRTHRPAPTPLAARRVPRAIVPPRPGPRSPRGAPPRGPARPGPPPRVQLCRPAHREARPPRLLCHQSARRKDGRCVRAPSSSLSPLLARSRARRLTRGVSLSQSASSRTRCRTCPSSSRSSPRRPRPRPCPPPLPPPQPRPPPPPRPAPAPSRQQRPGSSVTPSSSGSASASACPLPSRSSRRARRAPSSGSGGTGSSAAGARARARRRCSGGTLHGRMPSSDGWWKRARRR